MSTNTATSGNTHPSIISLPLPISSRRCPRLDDHIRYLRPFILDDVAVALSLWSGYNVLAQHRRKDGAKAGNPVRAPGAKEPEDPDIDRSPHLLYPGAAQRTARDPPWPDATAT
jgi:hypothetical protein